jgi:hypothetical protein
VLFCLEGLFCVVVFFVISLVFCVLRCCAGSHLRDSSIAVAYTADGCLSVWDCLSRVCLQKVTVLELLGLAGEGHGGVSVEGLSVS